MSLKDLRTSKRLHNLHFKQGFYEKKGFYYAKI